MNLYEEQQYLILRHIFPVLIRQLGFQAATAIVLNAAFGPGTGPIYMDDVQCDGSESSLLDCQLGQHLGSHDCWHSKDTGVVCTDEGMVTIVHGLHETTAQGSV